MSSLTDNHTLYVLCGYATGAQVQAAFVKFIAQWKVKKPCEVYVNDVTNNEGQRMKLCFVYLSNEYYYSLLTKGEEKIIEKKIIVARANSESRLWADLAEDDDMCDAWENDSTVSIPTPKSDGEQTVRIERKTVYTVPKLPAIKAMLDGKAVDVNLVYYAAKVILGTEDIKLQHNVLCSRGNVVPEWATEIYIRKIFGRYVTMPGRNNCYPIVNIVRREWRTTIYVEYHPRSNDARFALLMTKRMRCLGKEGSITFGHAYAKDDTGRDKK